MQADVAELTSRAAAAAAEQESEARTAAGSGGSDSAMMGMEAAVERMSTILARKEEEIHHLRCALGDCPEI